MDHEALILDLAGRSYPLSIRIGERFRREWIVRSVNLLPLQQELDVLQIMLENTALASIANTCSLDSSSEVVRQASPSILLARLSHVHLLVRIDFSGPDISIGDSAAISQWGVLQVLDREIAIDDLQGLPRAFWWFLTVADEVQPR